MAGAWPDLVVSDVGAIAEVRLNRPKARNALSRALMEQLIEVASELRKSTSVQAVILTGAPGYFSAGASSSTMPQASAVSAGQGSQKIAKRLARAGPTSVASLGSVRQLMFIPSAISGSRR